MSSDGIVCLVTIHGIGFQQPPGEAESGQPDRPGYADLLHQYLAAALTDQASGRRLSDDPDRQRYQHGPTVPIYVESNWPPVPGRSKQVRETGLERLGTWSPNRDRIITSPKARLVSDGAEIAHVALVYTGLEESKPDLLALVQAASLGLRSIGRYDSMVAIVRTVVRDVSAMFRKGSGGAAGAVSLQVRSDPTGPVAPAIANIPRNSQESILLQIEDDVGAYVSRNQRRELVRGFVEEALLRLLLRDDVRTVVVNAHSQGTVVAYDVLRQLPGAALDKVGAFITAGSPLRKYATALSWGSEVGRIQEIETWLNFYDERDVVADKLQRPARGRRQADDPAPPGALFWWRNPVTGVGEIARVEDEEVHNLRNSPPGSLQAHDYWDNQVEFVPKLAKVLSTV